MGPPLDVPAAGHFFVRSSGPGAQKASLCSTLVAFWSACWRCGYPHTSNGIYMRACGWMLQDCLGHMSAAASSVLQVVSCALCSANVRSGLQVEDAGLEAVVISASHLKAHGLWLWSGGGGNVRFAWHADLPCMQFGGHAVWYVTQRFVTRAECAE